MLTGRLSRPLRVFYHGFFRGAERALAKVAPYGQRHPGSLPTNHRVDSLGIVSFGYALIVKFKTFACVESVVTVGRK